MSTNTTAAMSTTSTTTTAARHGANGCRQNHRYGKNHNFPEHGAHSFDTPDSLSTPAGVARQSANAAALNREKITLFLPFFPAYLINL
jgi:hypothetical protein